MQLDTLLLPALTALTATCEFTCPDTPNRVACAEAARDALLNRYRCITWPDSTFLYNGGHTVVSAPGTSCSATIRGPELQVYVNCSQLRGWLDGILDGCVRNGAGGGRDQSVNWGWGISTC